MADIKYHSKFATRIKPLISFYVFHTQFLKQISEPLLLCAISTTFFFNYNFYLNKTQELLYRKKYKTKATYFLV